MLASLCLSPAQLSGIVRCQGWGPRQTTHTEVLHRGGVGGDNLYVAASLHQLQQKWLFESVSQERWQRRKGVLAEPFQEGRPAGVTSANAYTLSLWAGDEDRTLTGRHRKRGESERTITQPLRDFGIFFLQPFKN